MVLPEKILDYREVNFPPPMLRYGTTGHSMVPNGVIGDLYVQFPFQQKKNLLNSYTGSASGTTFGQGGSRGGGLS